MLQNISEDSTIPRNIRRVSQMRLRRFSRMSPGVSAFVLQPQSLWSMRSATTRTCRSTHGPAYGNWYRNSKRYLST